MRRDTLFLPAGHFVLTVAGHVFAGHFSGSVCITHWMLIGAWESDGASDSLDLGPSGGMSLSKSTSRAMMIGLPAAFCIAVFLTSTLSLNTISHVLTQLHCRAPFRCPCSHMLISRCIRWCA